ncbi:MAG: response regulator [Alphaproteobacteria bacterium]|jgi:PAS domain S-box-containing protein|nr:response regulator [Alphaproteobacteria bacterium]
MPDSKSRSDPLGPDGETSIAHLRKRLDRERRARIEAERLLEAKSTELFDACERLKAEARRAGALASAVEAASDGIALADANGIFTHMNTAHAHMFGYETHELIGQLWSDLYEDDTARYIDEVAMPDLFENGHWRGEVTGRSKAGAPVHQEVVLSLRNDGGLICATREIGERLEREREAHELEARLRKAEHEAALFTLGNAVAHDFNNLIAAISGYARLLQSDLQEGGESHDRAARILEAAEQASDVVRSLEVDRHNDIQKTEEIDLVKLLRTGLAISRAIRPAGIRVETNLPESAIVRCNEVLLSRALINIAKNAFEAMGERGVLSVNISFQPSLSPGPDAHSFCLGETGRTGTVVLEMCDTGPGICQSRLQEIFQPFTTSKPPMRGSGLGLLSLKALADSRTAGVEVESSPGNGTCFRIHFGEPAGARASDTVPDRLEGDIGERVRVLVVDDNAAVGKMLTETLVRLGFDAIWEGDAACALDRIETESFRLDVLLTDLTMPAMDGNELARRARAARASLPMILYSGQSGYIQHDPVFADILTKPIAPERLKRAIHAAIENQSWRSILGL